MYLALAVEEGIVLVSGDQRLVNSLKGTPLQKHIAWIRKWLT